MIATDRFVFIHLHTCGGSYVTDFLLRSMPDARRIGSHLPRRLLPPSLGHLPVLGFVRNPWHYYVLWYDLQLQRAKPNPLFRILSEEGRLDFEHTLANMLNLGVTGNLLDASVAALPQGLTGSGLNLPGAALAQIRGSGLGLFSFLYGYMYDAPGVLHVRRIERVREELIPMLQAVAQPVSAAMRAYVLDAPLGDALQSKPYADHYNDALRDLVAERDANIIARHGYRFGE
ncbi:MAG TPA: hypothetical protein VII70_07615 [Steroidobacteraceae bacterium]